MYATDLALSPPFTNTTDNGLEIDLSVSNQGMLGAQQLKIKIELAEDSDWKGVSSDSGWQCLSYDAELHCARPTLSEQRESRFTVLVDPASGSAEDIRILLTSRTHDLNTNNNVFNDTYEPWQAADDNSNVHTLDTVTLNQTPSSEQNIPVVAAAQGGGNSSADDTGVGAGNGTLIGLALLAWGWRRRRC